MDNLIKQIVYTEESPSVFKTTMVGSVSRPNNDRLLYSYLKYHHSGPASDIMVWDGIVITLTPIKHFQVQ